ncbi:MAG: molybdopterin-dependent oxidoreductase, partial [Oceanicaulis sp.]|nr:molybdopterin-dependent oxidoreductase [Oceanicaulis sp.]
AAYTEKNGIYVNTEGRAQLALRAVFPKGEAKEDWAIFRALSARLNKTLPYDDLNALRASLIEANPVFGQIDYAPGADGAADFDPAQRGEAGAVSDAPFASPIRDFYLTNPIARASKTMGECSAVTAAARAELQAAE